MQMKESENLGLSALRDTGAILRSRRHWKSFVALWLIAVSLLPQQKHRRQTTASPR
jgi:hypothetical protein